MDIMKICTKIMMMFSVLFLISCNDWLDLKPEGQATSDELFSTGDGYRSVLNGVYKKMGVPELYGFELQFGMIDCMSQQYVKSRMENGNMAPYVDAANYDFKSNNLQPKIEKLWANAYNVIANANNLIQMATNASPDLFELGEIERKMILGEAYACRALMHFDLLRLFAPAPVNDDGKAYIPYVDKYPNIEARSIAVDPFLEKVITDLELASSLTIEFDTTALGQSVSASGKTRFYGEFEYGMEGNTNAKKINDFYKGRGYRLSYYAATALLARVHQYAGHREKAFELAKKVLEFKAVGLGSSYDMFSVDDFSGFQNTAAEDKKNLKVVSNLVFAVYNEKSYDENKLSQFFRKKSEGMNTAAWFQIAMGQEEQGIFYNADGEDEAFMNPEKPWESRYDLRGVDLIFRADNYVPISAKWYWSDNTEIRNNNVTILPVIRATEMRYIMAEEYARQGNYEEAYGILNKIRADRGLWGDEDKLEVGSTYEQFQEELIRDARREWLSEGQLFYLYKRLNAPVKLGKDETRPLRRNEYLLPVPSNQSL